MGLSELTSRAAVHRALAEFDELGRKGFLDKYGFGEARSYFLRVDGRDYDSKAVVAAAHGFEHPAVGPLTSAEFSGGEATVARKLRSLGFEVVNLNAGRNPTWAFDELILALELYLRRGLVEPTDPEVVELSQLLNSLPIHAERPDAERFRNPNGVSLKLANFAALDPAYPGTGMSRGSRRDAEVWDRFAGSADELSRLATLIRSGVDVEYPATPEEGEDEVAEGRLLYRRHRTRERDRSVVERKKRSVLQQSGRLCCEACGFDFALAYGDLGEGFIECHHTRPLSESGETTTRLNDLALLCSNCHRVVHRRRPWPAVAELRAIVAANRSNALD